MIWYECEPRVNGDERKQVVSATLVPPQKGGKERCDLIVWDGSLPPNTFDMFVIINHTTLTYTKMNM